MRAPGGAEASAPAGTVGWEVVARPAGRLGHMAAIGANGAPRRRFRMVSRLWKVKPSAPVRQPEQSEPAGAALRGKMLRPGSSTAEGVAAPSGEHAGGAGGRGGGERGEPDREPDVWGGGAPLPPPAGAGERGGPGGVRRRGRQEPPDEGHPHGRGDGALYGDFGAGGAPGALREEGACVLRATESGGERPCAGGLLQIAMATGSGGAGRRAEARRESQTAA